MSELPIPVDQPPAKAEIRDPYLRLRSMLEITDIESREGLFQVEPPEQVKFEAFGEAGVAVEESYRSMYRWLNLPFISDTFEDHNKRSQWVLALKKEERDLVHANKYRNNPATLAIMALQELLAVLPKGKDALEEEIRETIQKDLPSKYFTTALPKTKSKVERRVILEKLETKVAEVLSLIASTATSKMKRVAR